MAYKLQPHLEAYQALSPKGVDLITKEREEQISKHGRTLISDLQDNPAQQISEAASMLCYDYGSCITQDDVVEHFCPKGWDKKIWKKMAGKPYKERLIIAGALIAAELDRLTLIETKYTF